MLRIISGRFGWMLFLVLGLSSVAAQAEQFRHDSHDQFRYRYVSLDQYVPDGYLLFEPAAIDGRGRVYCNVLDDSEYLPHIAVYEDGAMTIVPNNTLARAIAVNKRGTVGGAVLVDPINYLEQAALFNGDQVELIPPQPNEIMSEVVALNDRGTALIKSLDSAYFPTYFLYRKGQTTLLDFGPGNFTPNSINDRGIIAGILSKPLGGSRGFRFDPLTGRTTLLNPLPSEPTSWGLDINDRGEVLGYSFIAGKTERIGVWDGKGIFKTYFVEGIPDFPTVSNSLLFNDDHSIVITNVQNPPDEMVNSYLVPKPGIRLNLADLVVNLPSEEHVNWILDINKKGSMIGWNIQNYNILGSYLLERINNRHH